MPSRENIILEFTAVLAAICSSCTGLQSLELLYCEQLDEAALCQVSALRQLRHLAADCELMGLGPAAGAALGKLPHVRSLVVSCRALSASGAQALLQTHCFLYSRQVALQILANSNWFPPSLPPVMMRQLHCPLPAALTGLSNLTHLGLTPAPAYSNADMLSNVGKLPLLQSLVLGGALKAGVQTPLALLLADCAQALGASSCRLSRLQLLHQGPWTVEYTKPFLSLSTLAGLEELTACCFNIQVPDAARSCVPGGRSWQECKGAAA